MTSKPLNPEAPAYYCPAASSSLAVSEEQRLQAYSYYQMQAYHSYVFFQQKAMEALGSLESVEDEISQEFNNL